MPCTFSSLRPALVLAIALTVAACESDTTRMRTTEWTLAWSDEFDGPAGASVDGAKWVADTGGQGWGNQERQYYTDRSENVSLDGSGHLAITARAEPLDSPYGCWYGICRYTSARLKTKDRFE